MADTPEVRMRFTAEGADAVASAVRQLSQELQQLKQRQQEANESALTLALLLERHIHQQLFAFHVGDVAKGAIAAAREEGWGDQSNSHSGFLFDSLPEKLVGSLLTHNSWRANSLLT
jgi:hypothetical protein